MRGELRLSNIILVTGATGTVGSKVVKQLLLEGQMFELVFIRSVKPTP